MTFFSANQKFYSKRDTGEIIGVYVLSENLRTVLPYKPSVDFSRINSNFDNISVSNWILYFVALNERETEVEMQIEISYEDFIKYLPKEKYEFIDAKFIAVEKMTREEIMEIYKEVI